MQEAFLNLQPDSGRDHTPLSSAALPAEGVVIVFSTRGDLRNPCNISMYSSPLKSVTMLTSVVCKFLYLDSVIG